MFNWRLGHFSPAPEAGFGFNNVVIISVNDIFSRSDGEELLLLNLVVGLPMMIFNGLIMNRQPIVLFIVVTLCSVSQVVIVVSSY